MAITQVGSTQTNSGTTQGITVTKPTGVAVGNVMIACVTTNDDTITTPSGWTLKQHDSNGPSGNWGQAWYYKVAVSADVSASNYTWNTGADDGAPTIVYLSAWAGVDQNNPIGGFSQTLTSSGITEPVSTGTCTNGVGNGRVFYNRSARKGTVSPISFSSASSGVTQQSNVGQNASTVSYSQCVYVANSDFATTSNPSAITITASPDSDTHNVVSVLILNASVSASANLATGVTTTAYAAGVQTINPGVGVVTAAANDATVAILPVADIASATVAASGAVRSIPADLASATAAAYEASVGMQVYAGLAEVTTDAKKPIAYYGAPTVRMTVVEPENRTYMVRR